MSSLSHSAIYHSELIVSFRQTDEACGVVLSGEIRKNYEDVLTGSAVKVVGEDCRKGDTDILVCALMSHKQECLCHHGRPYI